MLIRTAVGMVAAMLLVTACGEDEPLASRKQHCDNYVKKGYITKDEVRGCYRDKTIFSFGASKAVKNGMDVWYPRVVRAAQKLDAHARAYDKSDYAPFPREQNVPLFLSDVEARKPWRFVIELHNVNFSRPEGDSRGWWSVSGSQLGQDQLTLLPIAGVGPYALQELDWSCSVFWSRNGGNGCRARIYLDTVADGLPLPQVAAMAIELIPPSEDDARRALMDFEMLFWEPKKARR